MDMAKIPLFSMLSNRMNWLSTRQSLLSENVANSTTPNYKARDLSPVDFASQLSSTQSASDLKITNVRHLAATGRGPSNAKIVASAEGGTPGGNAVSLEQQMIKLSETQIQFQTAANLYQKGVNMLRTALVGRGQ